MSGITFHTPDVDQPRSYRRAGKQDFVVGVVRLPRAECTLDRLYPLLVRTLSNLVLAYDADDPETAWIVTPEYGLIHLSGPDLAAQVNARLEPMATARLVIDNVFTADLEPALWSGDAASASIKRAGRFLAELNLLPAPFPIDRILPEEDLRYLKRVYGFGGLSYGNFSARLDGQRFWMSASGVDKSRLEIIGRDIVLVTGYDEAAGAMTVSVPPDIEPRRASVDAIEHWMIYREVPDVGAVLHVHAWLNGVSATPVHYPCGTLELAHAVANLVKAEPDPGRAIVGLKNHGLTITGPSLDEIIERVSGRLVRQVPFS